MKLDWIVPDWPAAAHVRAFITTRSGGVSTGPYSSMNLGYSTGDEPDAVRTNRQRVRDRLPSEPRWLRQIHGARVVNADRAREQEEADASFTGERGTVCTVLVADCLPVLLTNRAGTRVGVAHAGWRGVAAGVIEATVSAMRHDGDDARDEILAYIGPGIGPNAFEVGDDVHHTFTSRDGHASHAFRRSANGKWLADLPMLARQALARAQVQHVYGGTLCTYAAPDRFYSYRRERVTGRLGAFIWIA